MFHLKPKPSPPWSTGAGHAGPRGRLLGGHDHAGHAPVRDLVQLAQEVDRLEVLAAAVDVRQPLPLVARVVEVEHRRDGVDAQAVGVVALEPEERAREQEVPHLGAAVVEDQRPPVGVRPAARILVLVEGGAVEAGERQLVAREVRRNPVEDHADTGAVEPVDEGAQVVRRAEDGAAARRSPSPGSPTSPANGCCITGRSSTWVKPRSATYVRELVRRARGTSASGCPRAGSSATSRGAPRRRTSAPRGARQRRGARARPRPPTRGAARRRPTPSAAASPRRRQPGRPSAGETRPAPGSRTCRRLRGDVGHEELPDPRRAERAHRVQAPVPAVEVADDARRSAPTAPRPRTRYRPRRPA